MIGEQDVYNFPLPSFEKLITHLQTRSITGRISSDLSICYAVDLLSDYPSGNLRSTTPVQGQIVDTPIALIKEKNYLIIALDKVLFIFKI